MSWKKTNNIPEGAGTIEDIVVRAKQKFSDVDMQAQYIKIAVGLIQRDFGDEVKTANFVYGNYDGVITMFASAGEVYAHWEMYENGGLEGSGLEKYSTSNGTFHLLFSSSPEFNRPLLPIIMSNAK